MMGTLDRKYLWSAEDGLGTDDEREGRCFALVSFSESDIAGGFLWELWRTRTLAVVETHQLEAKS